MAGLTTLEMKASKQAIDWTKETNGSFPMTPTGFKMRVHACFPSKAGAVSQNSSLLDCSCPLVRGMSDFQRILSCRSGLFLEWVVWSAKTMECNCSGTRRAWAELWWWWWCHSLLPEDVESLKAEGLRLPCPLLLPLACRWRCRWRCVPTQPPMVTTNNRASCYRHIPWPKPKANCRRVSNRTVYHDRSKQVTD